MNMTPHALHSLLRKMKIMARILIALILLLSPIILIGQQKRKISCDKIRNGNFFYYHSEKSYSVIRQGNKQLEIDLSTGDTTFLEVTWLSDCMLNLKSLSSTVHLSQEEELFFKAHPVNIEILNVTEAYYTFKGAGADPSLAQYVIQDTIWFKRKN